jgi:hypothetical protein
MRPTAATGQRDREGTYEPCGGPKRTLVAQAGSRAAKPATSPSSRISLKYPLPTG